MNSFNVCVTNGPKSKARSPTPEAWSNHFFLTGTLRKSSINVMFCGVRPVQNFRPYGTNSDGVKIFSAGPPARPILEEVAMNKSRSETGTA